MPKLDRAPEQMRGSLGPTTGDEGTHVAVPLAGFSGDLTVLVRPLVASGFRESPPLVTLMFLWDEQFGVRITDAGATSSRVSFVRDVPAVALPDVGAALDDLAGWTALGSERLAYMFAASRRSIYNWRQGAPISSDTGARIVRTHGALKPLAARLAPALLRNWLEQGTPSAVDLAHEDRWPELEERIAHQLAPPRLAAPVTMPDVAAEEDARFSAQTRNLMLARFNSGVELRPRRPDWSPRETTGLGDEEQDED